MFLYDHLYQQPGRLFTAGEFFLCPTPPGRADEFQFRVKICLVQIVDEPSPRLRFNDEAKILAPKNA